MTVPAAPLRPIAVWPDRYVPGGGEAVLATWDDVWSTDLDMDAHAPGYLLPGANQMRVRIDMIPDLIEKGREPYLSWGFLDFDTDGHAPADGHAVLEQVVGALLALELGAEPWCYSTRAGARAVYALEPLPVSRARAWDDLVHEIGAEVNGRIEGASLDLTSGQWTRCFRLPRVVRDGEATDPWVFDGHGTLDLSDADVEQAEFSRGFQLEDLDEVPPPRAWYHLVQPRHASYPWRYAIARGWPIDTPAGDWHRTLVRIVASLTAILARTETSDRELGSKVFAILAPSVRAGATSEEEANDLDQLSDLCRRYASRREK